MNQIDWPWFKESHRELDRTLASWIEQNPQVGDADETEADTTCRSLVRLLGDSGWLQFTVPAEFGGRSDKLDVRSLCLLREKLAYQSGLADFAFAMQGLGAGPISLFGSADLKRRYLPRVARGESIAAFAISEAEAGSDAAGTRTQAVLQGDQWVINGGKTFTTNAHNARFCVSARSRLHTTWRAQGCLSPNNPILYNH